MIARTTTAAVPGRTATPRPARFADTLRSEWRKFLAIRSNAIMLGLGVVLSVATTAIAAAAIGGTQDQWPEDLDVRIFWLVGNIFSLIIFSVFGVLAATREYATGMIRPTLAATPRRGRVFAAKFLLTFLATLAGGLASTSGMYLAGHLVNSWYGMPAPGLNDPGMLRLFLGIALAMPFFPILGLALGMILRSSAAAITTVLALLWLPVILGETLPTWWRENVISLLPSSAVDSFTIAHIAQSAAYPDPAWGVVITGAWLAIIAGGAWIAFARRDA